jgi:hypothetical protein
LFDHQVFPDKKSTSEAKSLLGDRASLVGLKKSEQAVLLQFLAESVSVDA